MSQTWKTVYIFISSTFNDMHAERDFLVKSVFPRLSEWCSDRKLRLVDIDLRWGVTEQDAEQNKNVVKVCLDRIDDCRPFFLCFLGQRRGWVPEEEHISKETIENFPDIEGYIGTTSITEMEILHALASPILRADGKETPPSEHSFFYLRAPDYLERLTNDNPKLRHIFTNEPIKKDQQSLAEQRIKDQQLAEWRDKVIPGLGKPVRNYTCRWDSTLLSPELAPKGAVLGADLTRGRLVDFQTIDAGQQIPLDEAILEDFKSAIAARYPEHMDEVQVGELQRELDQQEQFLFASSEGFISRGDDFKDLDAYLAGNDKKVFLLTAPAGSGKSTLLANWLTRVRETPSLRNDSQLIYRFIGASDRSTTVTGLLQFLLRELKEVQGIYNGDIPADPLELRRSFPKIMSSMTSDQKIILLLDGINQLESGLNDLGWLPWSLPDNLKLIISFKAGEDSGDELLQRLAAENTAILSEVKPFEDLEDRRRLVNSYLSKYLKDLDTKHLETLIQSPGAANPLYLKVVLSELRVFGVFEDLGSKIKYDFGDTPVTAFQAVLERMESDPGYTSLEPYLTVPLLFGLLAHARRGLSVDELGSIFLTELGLEDNPANRRVVAESIHLYLRQTRPFLANRDQRYDFFYESFRIAARQRYATPEEGILIIDFKTSPEWHALLADYFSCLPLWQSPEKKASVLRKVSEMPYHLAWSDSFKALKSVLSDFEFLAAKVSSLGPIALLEDYDLFQLPAASDPEIVPPEELEEIFLIQRAISLSVQVLSKDPLQIASQLYGRLHALSGALIDHLKEGIDDWDQPWLRSTVPSLTSPTNSLIRLIPAGGGPIEKVALSPDGRWGAASNIDFIIEVWDLIKGIKVAQLEPDYLDDDDGLALSTDGRYLLISIAAEESLQLWELETLSERPLSEAVIDGIFYSYDSGEGKLVEDWPQPDQEAPDNFVVIGESQAARINFGALNNYAEQESSDGRYAFRPVFESTLGLFDQSIKDESGLVRAFPGHFRTIQDLAISPNGVLGASLCFGNKIKLWGLDEGIEICEITANASKLAFTPDSEQLVSLGDLLQVWALDIFDDLVRAETQIAYLEELVVTPDGRSAIGAAKNAAIRIWDLKSGDELDPILESKGILDQIAITPDGSTAVVGDIGNSLLVWDLERGVELEKFPDPIGVQALSITPDGGRFAGGGGYQILIWDRDSSEQKILKSQHQFITDIALSPDGNRVLSVSSDRSLELWDIEREEVLASFTGENPLSFCALGENGGQIMAGEESGLIHILLVEGLPPSIPSGPPDGGSSQESPLPEELSQEALETGQSGEYEAALEAYNQLLEAYPENIPGRIDKIDLLFAMGRFKAAADYAEETLKMPIESPLQQAILHNWRGNSLYQMGEFEQAILAYDQAIKGNPKDFMIYYNRGMAYFKLKYFESALEEFKRARQIKPGPESTIQIAQCHMMLDNYEQAAVEYSALINSGLEDARFYYMLGIAQNYIGDVENSRANLEYFLMIARPEHGTMINDAQQILGL